MIWFYHVAIQQGGKILINILYEDNHLLVVEKPINIPVQKDSSNDEDLQTMLKKYLVEKYNKPGDAYLGIIHRLDRPVGGIMVFAKTSKCASRIQKQMEDKSFCKYYYAVVENSFSKMNDEYIDYIDRDDKGNAFISKNGKKASLSFEVVKEINNKSLVRIKLDTGRHHQIRVQFKSHGHPLCGDQRYNKMDNTQIALFAYKLEFLHPTTKEKMYFEIKPNYSYFKEFHDFM